MTVVAAYDVAEDGRRSRLAAVLQSVGDRIQKSVFLLTLTDDQLRDIEERARAILDLDADSLYIFKQCHHCWDAVECIGQADPPSKVLYWAVL